MQKYKKTFWERLPIPFFALAPMANVTDAAFRKIIAKYGKPDVTWTEFVSADGLISAGKKKLLIDLEYSNKERPIIAQLFTGHPEVMKQAARLIRDLKFDGLDINMGCPDRAVEKQGGGAALMKQPGIALEVLEAAREGVRSSSAFAQATADKENEARPPSSAQGGIRWARSTPFFVRPGRNTVGKKLGDLNTKLEVRSTELVIGLPISVKTRIGYNKIDLEWIKFLLNQNLPAMTVHLRTRKEMSDVPAHWELMPEIIKIRDEISPETLIIGNGDVESIHTGREMALQYGCDGIMIGRGIFGKPWLFGQGNDEEEKSPAIRLKVLMEHAKLFENKFCKNGHKSFDVMKKHFKAYVSGWDGAKELRIKLMAARSASDVRRIISEA